MAGHSRRQLLIIRNLQKKLGGIPYLRLMMAAVTVIIIFSVVVFVYFTYASQGKSDIIPVSTNNLISSGQWAYLTGAIPEKDGLHIEYSGITIVEQDGSGGQPNPPVNEYGTHLNIKTKPGHAANFSINTVLEKIKDAVAIEFYSRTPPISDEFRVEVPSVRLTIADNKLTVDLWDGKATQDLANQQPLEQQTFPVVSTSLNHETQLGMVDQYGQLSFSINGRGVGQIADANIFDQNQVWFGADAPDIGDSFTLNSLPARGLQDSTIEVVDTSTEPPVVKVNNGLQELATKKRSGFLIGSDAALWATTWDNQYKNVLFDGNFGIITPENALKWQFTEPQPNVYDFSEADALVNDALKNGLQIHGHALVFSEALPKWVQDLPTITAAEKTYVKQVMVDHITALVSHFKGRVSEWDVVDEPIADYGTFDPNNTIYRDNVFFRAMGQSYISIALQAAYAADPQAKLFINDFGNENDDGERWQATYTMLGDLVENHIPLYGFGFESHIYDPASDNIVDSNGAAPVLEKHINELAGIGIQSSISEMDTPLNDPGYAAVSSSQAQQFAGVLSVCINNPHCVRFSIWSLGITDLSQDYNTHELDSIEIDSPFNQAMQPTAAYSSLEDILR